MREDRVTSDWPHVHDQDSVTLKTCTSGVELLFFFLCQDQTFGTLFCTAHLPDYHFNPQAQLHQLLLVKDKTTWPSLLSWFKPSR